MAGDRDDVRGVNAIADENGMNPPAEPAPFDPWLGLAIKGMWATTFTLPLVRLIDLDSRPSLNSASRVSAGQQKPSSEVPDRTD